MKNNKIRLNKDVSMDISKFIETGLVILANSGGGKSYAIRKIAEEADGKVQVIILDPEGEFASLREEFDFILAGKNADVPVEVRSAALFATKLLELGSSAIIDLYELHPRERQQYVRAFCDAIVNCPKELYHDVVIILDEAHEYAPEGKPSEATWSVELLASKGRKRGQRLVLASQRIAKLSKNVTAECNNKLIGRASQDIDMKRAGDELGFSKEKLVQLRQLKPGEFFAFGPAISEEVIKIKIGDVKTSHGRVTYKGAKKTPPPSSVIKKILGELHDLPAEAEKEAKTVAEMKKEISDLKRTNTNLLKNPYQKDETYKQGILVGRKDTEMAVRKALDKQGYEHTKELNKRLKVFESIQKLIDPFIKDGLALYSADSEAAFYTPLQGNRPDVIIYDEIIPGDPSFSKKDIVSDTGMTHAKKTGYVDMDGHTVGPMGSGEKLILTAIVQHSHDGITTEHLSIVTGYKETSRRTYLQRLSQKGYIRSTGGGHYLPTDKGLNALGDYTPLPEGRDLLDHYLQTLPDGEKKVLAELASVYPDSRSNQTLQFATNYKETSVRTYLQRLSQRNVIEKTDSGEFRVNKKFYE